jgi:hypothetical protein
MRHSVFAGLGSLAVLAFGAASSPETFAAFTWRSEPPPSCPFARSETVTGIEFTGRHIKYFGADTWYPSWAKDGNLHSPWTDGVVDGLRADSNGKAKSNTGFAILGGDDPLHLRLVVKGTYPGPAAPYGGRYPSASLFCRGVWYYGTYCLMDSDGDPGKGLNWDILGPFVGLRISYDNGRSWVETLHTPTRPIFPEPTKPGGKVRFGAPHFVDFGPELRDSPDGKAYLVGHGASDPDPEPRPANASWITGDQVFLARVTPDPKTVNDLTAWEFYAGKGAAGEPIWSHDFDRVKPLLDWNNHLGNVSITYDGPLKRYLMAVTDGGDTVSKFNSMVLEADRITGPWRLAVYMKNFGEQAYFVNFPSKFIGQDGRILWMCYSANFSNGVPEWPHHNPNPPGSGYGLILQEVRLLAGRQN